MSTERILDVDAADVVPLARAAIMKLDSIS
jgi:hypothetical protein